MLRTVKELDAVRAVQRWYSRIHLACCRDQKGAGNTASGISPCDSCGRCCGG
jgi:hypothetical protein